MTHLYPWIALIAALVSAFLFCRSISRGWSTRSFLLSLSILWMILLIAPVQCLGAFQIAGFIPRFTVRELALVQLIILAGALILSYSYRGTGTFFLQRDNAPYEPWPFYLKVAALVIGASYFLFAVDLWLSLPKGSDALAYHIPVAVRFLQDGSLRVPLDKAWQLSLPGNGEIVMMFALATGRQALIPLPNMLSIVVLALALYPLAAKFSGGMKAPALAATMVVFTIPMIEFQAVSGYVDDFGLGFLFAAVALFQERYGEDRYGRGITGVEAEKTDQPRSLSLTAIVFAGLACGLTLGTKFTFIPYCALFLAIAVYLLWRERRVHNKSVAQLAIILVIGMLLPSAFWYGRNLQATGNPLYPMPVAVRSHLIFPGFATVAPNASDLLVDNPPGGFADQGDWKFVRRRAEWLIYPWTEWLRNPGIFPIVYGEASGLGGAFATFAVLGIGFAAYLCLFRSVSKKFPGIPPSIFPLWLVLILIWAFGMRRVLRFALPAFILACLLSAPVIHLLRKAYPRGLAILFVCAVATTCAVSSLIPLHDLASHLAARKWSRATAYTYPPFIDNLPPGSCILNDTTLTEKDFALAGANLTNRVVTAFEAPRNLTPEFIRFHNIDYVALITSPADQQDPSPAELPASVAGSEVFHATQAGKTWSIWKVKQ